MSESLKQEEKRFNKYLDIVQDTAKAFGKQFFLDCGEGREFFLEDIEGEDLRGWLIPISDVDSFKKEWDIKNVSDKWIDNMIWAEWKNDNGIITVEFNNY